MSKIVDCIYDKVESLLAENGYELIDITYQKEYDEMHLTIVINKPCGISFDDLERVNALVEPMLDELDPTEGAPYNLDVSSMGLDRPIATAKDFARSLNTDVICSLYKPLNKKKSVEGTLVGYDTESVTLKIKEKEIKLERKLISVIKPKIDF